MERCISNEGLDDPNCSLTIDEHMEIISDLLPQGKAWPRDPEASLMRFWRAFAGVVQYAEERVCELAAEFYCSSAKEHLTDLADQYGTEVYDLSSIDGACLKPGADAEQMTRDELCMKVAERITGVKGDFEAVALEMGWVAKVTDTSSEPHPVCGGWTQLGHTKLGPKPELNQLGSKVGLSGVSPYPETRAVDGPNRAEWDASVPRFGSGCPSVPGSELGQQDTWGCCVPAGYHEYPGGAPEAATVSTPSACSTTEGRSVAAVVERDDGRARFPHCSDGSGDFLQYTGHAHHWNIHIDIPASMALQDANSPLVTNFPQAGCFSCGDVCAPLRGMQPQRLLDRLNELKPAHTVITPTYVWN